MRIWIDADGCPVVQETIEIAKSNAINVSIVKNHAIRLESDYADVITVDVSRDAADFYIVNHLSSGDLVISQDLGLCAMALAKGAFCLNAFGKQVTHDNIDFLLGSRHVHRLERLKTNKGPKHKKRNASDDKVFGDMLKNLLSQLTHNSV